MTTCPSFSFGPLAVRVKEPSPGLFFWVVTQLSLVECNADICIDTSDHPYPTHDSAMCVGKACLKAYEARRREQKGLPPMGAHGIA